MKEKILNLLTAFAAGCALVVTLGSIRSGQLLGRAAASGNPQTPPKLIKNGPALAATGLRIGPSNAILTLVEFADFECPSCIEFAKAFGAFRRQYPQEVALVFHHFPLPYHNLAYPLARASECAAQQGRFEAFYRTVLEEHANLGIDPISRLIALIDLPDSKAFQKCALSSEKNARVDSDIDLAVQIGVPGTPGIVIGDTLYPIPPSIARLKEMLDQRRDRNAR